MGDPIRVLHVLGGLEAGGAESFVMNLYRAMDKKQVQFDFVKHNPHKGVFEDEITSLGGKIYLCPRYTGKNHFVYCKWWNDFFAEHPEYHVIHGHVRSTAAIYLRIAKKHGRITISHSHSTSNGKGAAAVVKDLMQLPIRNTADYLFACSDKAGRWLFGSKALQRSNYRMIPNGIDLKRFAFDEQKRQEMRSRLGIAENEFVIGHIGRFTEPKNHKFLVEMFSAYVKQHPNSRLLMVGDGELFAVVKEQCNQIGISDKVILPGSQTNTEDYYQIMDVFAFPSLWEGLGIAVIEAQANGLQCLLSENVPKEAILSKKVNVIVLNDMRKWLDTLEMFHIGERVPAEKSLLQYDVEEEGKKMEQFYLKQDKRVEQ